MAERQEHGFSYQKEIIEKHNLIKVEGYTNKWDAYEIYNQTKLPVSIKNVKMGGSIDFGDFKRQSEVDSDFLLYVGFWKNKQNNIVKEYKIHVYKDKWSSYFCNTDFIIEMIEEMKTISNHATDDNKWKEFQNKYKKIFKESRIKLRFKRDHKKQKRIQCGFGSKLFNNLVVKDNLVLSAN